MDAPPATTDSEALKLRADARRNRQRIIEAAREVFSQEGPDAQIDDVARCASVGVGTVYRHFPTKEALMAELVRQKFALFAANAERALDRDAEPFEALADLLRANAQACAEDAAMQYALSGAGEHVWAHADAEIRRLNELVGGLVERAHAAGTLRPDVSGADIPMLMCGVSATMTRRGFGFDWRRHLELVIDALRAER